MFALQPTGRQHTAPDVRSWRFLQCHLLWVKPVDSDRCGSASRNVFVMCSTFFWHACMYTTWWVLGRPTAFLYCVNLHEHTSLAALCCTVQVSRRPPPLHSAGGISTLTTVLQQRGDAHICVIEGASYVPDVCVCWGCASPQSSWSAPLLWWCSSGCARALLAAAMQLVSRDWHAVCMSLCLVNETPRMVTVRMVPC